MVILKIVGINITMKQEPIAVILKVKKYIYIKKKVHNG